MPTSTILIDMDGHAKEYVDILGKKNDYKNGSVNLSERNGKIQIKITAKNEKAIVTSMNSIMKQLKIVNKVWKLASK